MWGVGLVVWGLVFKGLGLGFVTTLPMLFRGAGLGRGVWDLWYVGWCFGVWGARSGFGVEGLGQRINGLGVSCLGFGIWVLRIGVRGPGFRVGDWGLGFRVRVGGWG